MVTWTCYNHYYNGKAVTSPTNKPTGLTLTTSPGNVDASGKFTWPAVAGATEYLVKLHNDTNNSDLFVLTTGVTTTAGALVDAAHAGNKWHITVAAINNNGTTVTQSIAEGMDAANELHYGVALAFDSPPAPTTTTTTTTSTTTGP